MSLAAVKEKIFGKKEKDWTVEDAFKYRDNSMMLFAAGSDEYAEMLSDEVYDRLFVYVEKEMFDMNRGIVRSKVFKKRINEAKVRAAKSDEKKEDDATPTKEEEKKDSKDPKKEEEKREREENEKVIDIVEKINQKEKEKAAKEQQSSSEIKDESKVEQQSEPVKEEKEVVNDFSITSDDMVDGIAKGIKYVNLYDKMRDDVKDLYDTMIAKKELQEIFKEYSNSITTIVNNILDIDKNTLNTAIKSDKKFKQFNDSLNSLSDTANASKDKDVIKKSIIGIFIAPEVNSFLRSIIKETKKEPDSDEVLSAVKDKIVDFKNKATETPDVVKDKLLSYLSSLADFNNAIAKANESKYDSKFIPKEKKSEDGIIFHFDKMDVPLDPAPPADSDRREKMTQRANKEIQIIISELDPMLDKSKYNISLYALTNGLYQLVLAENNSAIQHNFMIDGGVIFRRGLFIYDQRNDVYIPFIEKDIIAKLLNNPSEFVISQEERNKCNIYQFRQNYLYDCIDMKTGIDEMAKIESLSQDAYYTLGNNLDKILREYASKFGGAFRFRFKEFNNENSFKLISDRNVATNVIKPVTYYPISPIYTEINCKDGKVIMVYGDQTISFNL